MIWVSLIQALYHNRPISKGMRCASISRWPAEEGLGRWHSPIVQLAKKYPCRAFAMRPYHNIAFPSLFKLLHFPVLHWNNKKKDRWKKLLWKKSLPRGPRCGIRV